MSKKHAYYFPHYLNARNDSKILKLRRVLGLEGYSIYFMLLEVLSEQSDMKYPLEGLSELEFDLRISKEKIATVIHNYELFDIDEKSNFFSPKLNQYLHPFIEKGERARIAANKRWDLEKSKIIPENANAYANASVEGMQKHPNIDANAYPNADANKQINKQINKEDERGLNDIFFQFFRRVAGRHLTDDILLEEVAKFKNKYPNIHINQAGALINTWVANIGRKREKQKSINDFL